MKKFLSKEMQNLLKEANLSCEDFIRFNDFGGVCIRQTKNAIEIYCKARKNNIKIWA